VTIGQMEWGIVQAQWRCLINYGPRSASAGMVIMLLGRLVWYGGWLCGAALVFYLAAHARAGTEFTRGMAGGLFLSFSYWQTIPVFVATAGVGLDLRKLMVYPIPEGRLFTIEVLLRATAAVEMVLVTLALAAGLAFNRGCPWWAAPAVVSFGAFNLMLSAGLRDLLMRLFANRRVREVGVFVVVLVAALPQLVLARMQSMPAAARSVAQGVASIAWPWVAAARVASGEAVAVNTLWLIGWTLAAWLFARREFSRLLAFDAGAAGAADRAAGAGGRVGRWREGLFRLPSRLMADPMAAMLEKELRTLARSSRFRLLFMMGFTFGLLIWLPFLVRGTPGPLMSANYLTLVSLYAILCLGDVTLWNAFGFDRSAAQNYFLLPVEVSRVLVAKNLASATFVMLEIAIISVVCMALRFPVSAARVAEAFAVAGVFTVFGMALGNLASTHYPRAVDPSQSWRSSGGNRVQFLVFLAYPVIGAPIGLAYLARYAFHSGWAFYGVLGVDLAIGAVVYRVALESATETALEERERILETLGASQGPMVAS
jgi:ABC-2 type transport system permease protein